MVFRRKFWFARKLLVRQESILGVQRNFPNDTFLEETNRFKYLGSERECFGFQVKQKRQICQNCMPCVVRNTLRQKFLSRKKNLILTLFVDLEWRNSSFWRNFSTRVSKLKCKWPVKLFGKGFFGRRYIFIPSYGSSEEKLACRKTPVLSGMHSRYPAEHSEGQIFEKKQQFSTSWAPSENFWGYCENNFDRIAKTAVHVIGEAFGVEWFLFQKINFKFSFRLLVEEFRTLGKNTTSGVKLTNRCPQALQTKPGRTRKAFHVYRGTFWAEKFVTNKTFLPFGQRGKICGFLAEQFKQICQNSIPCVQKKILRQKVFFKKKNFNSVCWFWKKKFRTLANVFDKGVETKFKWPEEHFEKNSLGWSCNFLFFHGFSGETLICKKTPGSSGRHSRCQVELSKGHFSVKNKIFQTLRLWVISFWVSGETKTPEMSKLHAMWWEKHFERKVSFSKKHKFDSVCWFGMNKFQFLAKNFDKGVKNEVYVTSRTFWEKIIWRKIQFYIFPWFFRGNFDLQENSSFVRKAF